MGATAGSKSIELVIGAAPEGTTHLVGDAHRLEQVLINLTGNAIKFTERGSVTVSMELLSLEDDLATLRFSVRDTGIGIPLDKQRTIFDSFSQADTSTTRRYGGTGLGLAICRLLVERMGGRSRSGAEGQGCEFRFTTVLQTPPDGTDALPLGNLHVLVADDNELSRRPSPPWPAPSDGTSWRWSRERRRSRRPWRARGRASLRRPAPGLEDAGSRRTFHGVAVAGPAGAKTPPIVLLATAHSREELAKHPESRCVDGILSKPVTGSSLYNAVVEARLGAKAAASGAGVPNERPVRNPRAGGGRQRDHPGPDGGHLRGRGCHGPWRKTAKSPWSGCAPIPARWTSS
jgi:hypothetical protein